MNIDNLFESAINEVSSVKRVTKEEGQYKLVIKDGNGIEEFLFRHHRYNALRNELKKHYGDKVVERIVSMTKKLDSDSFKDDKVDLEITGEKVKLAESVDLVEGNVEFKDAQGKSITINGKPVTLSDLKSDYPKHYAALKAKLKADGKSLANFAGNDARVDVVMKSNGTVEVNYDA